MVHEWFMNSFFMNLNSKALCVNNFIRVIPLALSFDAKGRCLRSVSCVFNLFIVCYVLLLKFKNKTGIKMLLIKGKVP